MAYTQLSYEERVLIEGFLRERKSIRAIAQILGRSPNTIAREIREKQIRGTYQSKKAHHKTYWRRYVSKRGCLKVTLDSSLRKHVDTELKKGWSPERIAGYATRRGFPVSTKAVYRYVHRYCLERYLFWNAHHHHKGLKKRKGIVMPKDRRMYLEQRPLLEGSGHLEGDFIVSSHNSVSLLVVVDRFTRRTWIRKIHNRKHATVSRAFVGLLRGYKMKTLTLDNDISFNHWKKLEMLLRIPIYFTHPYCSWEKGLVENTNRWIRVSIEKKRDLSTVTDEELRSVLSFLNETPRQCLGFKTAIEVQSEVMRVS
jgi:IS30 family transposase